MISTTTSVNLIGAEVEHPEPGFELIAWKWVEIGTFSFELLEQRIAAMMGYRRRCGSVYGGGLAAAYLRDKGRVSTPYRNLVSRFSQNAGEMSRNDYEFCKRVANHVGYRFGNEQIIKVVSSGWSFVSAILGQMTYPVASLTLDSAGSYVMQGAPFTQGTIPSIPIGGSISPKGFLPCILLLVNRALLSDPLTSGLCWWLPPKFEASRQ
ncbi:hypothetical protein Tco_1088523 [Tanacetum coccineum]